MKLAIGNDHVAIEMKNEIKAYLESKGIEVIDVGTNSPERFNYPISGYKVAQMVASGEVDGGVLTCGTGVGISPALQSKRIFLPSVSTRKDSPCSARSALFCESWFSNKVRKMII